MGVMDGGKRDHELVPLTDDAAGETDGDVERGSREEGHEVVVEGGGGGGDGPAIYRVATSVTAVTVTHLH